VALNAAQEAAGLLGARLVRQSLVAGGDLSEVLAIRLDDGREALVKTGPAPATEARMLDAIAATGARAPAVLAFNQSILVLERLPSGGQLETAWRDLGSQLGKLHRVTAQPEETSACYGWDEDYAFGRVAIGNTRTDDWPIFWAEHRIVNHAAHVATDLAARLERVAMKLGDILPDRPAASLLHGDLWGGNVLVSDRRISGLIDPACYFGDREVDFAMLQVFNRPDPSLFDACDRLAAGYEERRNAYQLWPALVHLRLFGSAYRPMVEKLLAACGV
jgi:fructosamine-3-kinase